MTRDVLLTGYDAKRCARRIHNEWDPSAEKIAWEVPPTLQMRFDGGIAFEAAVFGSSRLLSAPHVTSICPRCAARARRSLRPCRRWTADVEVILGGWLPDDVAGGRAGKPDVLLRVEQGRYVPGDVKAHKDDRAGHEGRRWRTRQIQRARARDRRSRGVAAETTARFDDYLQLAHYWRMLQAIDRAPERRGHGVHHRAKPGRRPRRGGRVLTWLDLDVPFFETYSRSLGKAKRSALERYDHEQGFRLKVANAAVSGGPALVEPIFTDECDSCPWFDHCRSLVGDDRASAQDHGREAECPRVGRPGHGGRGQRRGPR